MNKSDASRRVVIAITESSPLPELWREAMNLLSESPAELMALFMDDERWRRAASLPFTRAITRMQQRIEKLAEEAELALAFEVLPESDQKRIEELVGTAQNVLIASSFIKKRPIYTHLTRCDCQILLIEGSHENQAED
jgi:hypothetical protein